MFHRNSLREERIALADGFNGIFGHPGGEGTALPQSLHIPEDQERDEGLAMALKIHPCGPASANQTPISLKLHA